MTNNLALFIIHHVFLTDDEAKSVAEGGSASCLGHCVPVWVDAKTGRTTEPAREVFCGYEICGSEPGFGKVDLIERKGYKITVPRAGAWSPPENIDFESMADWTGEMRAEFMAARDAWWFNNPRPPDAENILSGYLRFEVKEQGLKLGRRKYSLQHVVEIQSQKRLLQSLAG